MSVKGDLSEAQQLKIALEESAKEFNGDGLGPEGVREYKFVERNLNEKGKEFDMFELAQYIKNTDLPKELLLEGFEAFLEEKTRSDESEWCIYSDDKIFLERHSECDLNVNIKRKSSNNSNNNSNSNNLNNRCCASGGEPGFDPSSSSENVWACSSCTYENSSEIKKCYICGEERSLTSFCKASDSKPARAYSSSSNVDDSKGSSAKNAGWECRNCTFFNEKLKFQCGVCSDKNPNVSISPLKIAEAVSSSEIGGWKCTKCTFENASDLSKCEMCDNEKQEESRSQINQVPLRSR
jgi:hypothetical protein